MRLPLHMIAILTFSLLFLLYCQPPAIHVEQYTRDNFHFPYDFSHPDTSFLMPYELREISGLSPGPDDESLACIQDEKGYIFILDKKTGNVSRKVNFGGDNDYEGVEKVGNAMYVVKSTGTLYEVRDLSEAQVDGVKHGNDLDGDYDVEGLAYDTREKVLLLACKDKGDDGEKDQRQIFAFDPVSHSLFEDPWYLVKHKEIERFVKEKRDSAGYEKPFFEDLFENILDEFNFYPSGITILPETGHLCIISSKAHALIVMNREGHILAYAQLHPRLLPQPEGITIDSAGTIYISSEGNRSRGRVLAFRQKDS